MLQRGKCFGGGADGGFVHQVLLDHRFHQRLDEGRFSGGRNGQRVGG